MSIRDTEGKISHSGGAPVSVDFAREINLIARVSSMLHARVEPAEAWGGIIDQDLAAFGAVVTSTHQTLRCLLDAVVTQGAIEQEAMEANHIEELTDLTDVWYSKEPSSILGILMLEYLTGADIPALEARFPQLTDVTSQIVAAQVFFHQVIAIAEAVETERTHWLKPDSIGDWEDQLMALRNASSFLTKVQQRRPLVL